MLTAARHAADKLIRQHPDAVPYVGRINVAVYPADNQIHVWITLGGVPRQLARNLVDRLASLTGCYELVSYHGKHHVYLRFGGFPIHVAIEEER